MTPNEAVDISGVQFAEEAQQKSAKGKKADAVLTH